MRVLERHPASGAQRSPDWDAVENWTSPVDFPSFLRGIGVEPDRFVSRTCSAFSVIDPFGRRYDVQTPRPFFYLVKRGLAAGLLWPLVASHYRRQVASRAVRPGRSRTAAIGTTGLGDG